MKHRALEILHRLREYDLEKEEIRLMERQRDEVARQEQCQRSIEMLQSCYNHNVAGMKVHDFARRESNVREAGVRHNLDLRQLGLAQMAKRDQIGATLAAKTRADMIAKVLEQHRADDVRETDLKVRKEMDDLAQNQFTFRARQAPPEDTF